MERFIGKICRRMQLDERVEEYRLCGWEAFLRVYRQEPSAFYGSGERGWYRALLAVVQALKQERRQNGAWFRKCTSLNAPVSDEVPCPRIELLVAPHGDFVNGVCLYDYLRRMEADTCRMAFQLMRGDSLEEIALWNNWPPARARRLRDDLRAALERYLAL